ncbi:hypothetical protein OS493_026109 [Desmophyllum pertusum]|uniref:Uncharacterized protein n=1 Tax=Desmophyllum pertusum TaxID=174260 RepID=A0A9W9Y9Y4_9CNID|nr:hypothetical protein OS493_026109 [Desmophyllum pertusum]
MDKKCEQAGLLPVENSRYAMEGPLTTSHPTPSKTIKRTSLLHKEKICADGTEKVERETFPSLKSALPTHKNTVCGNPNNDNFFKMDSKNSVRYGGRFLKGKLRIPCSYNELERSLVKLQNCQGASNVIPGVSIEYNAQGQHSSEIVNELDVASRCNSNIVSTKRADNDNRVLRAKISAKIGSDLDKCCSDDDTNAAARTRVYHRKTKSRKQEQQNDLSPEIKCSKHEDPIAGQKEKKSNKSRYRAPSQLVNTSVADQRLKSRRRRRKEPQEQDSQRAGSSGKFLDDVRSKY